MENNLLSVVAFLLSFPGYAKGRKFLDSQEEYSFESIFSSTQATVAVCLSAFVFLLVVVVVLFKCTDCYNSEVSSENHPACRNSTGQKWGGSTGYYQSGNSGNGTVSFGETVLPSSNSLPPSYCAVLTDIPQHGGLQGYHTGEGVGTDAGGLIGYHDSATPSTGVSYTPGAAMGYQVSRSTHYNPAEQPPPPGYAEAVQRSNSHEYR